MSHFNKAGTLMFLVAFGSAWGILRAMSIDDEGLLMMMAGPLLAIFDVNYRRIKKASLFRGDGGGTFVFLPVWVWGVFWTGLGAAYHWRLV